MVRYPVLRIRGSAGSGVSLDPEPTFFFDADPDPTFHVVADPDAEWIRFRLLIRTMQIGMQI